MGDQLLTLHALATHLVVGDKTIARLLAEDPDFPRPIIVRGSRRWIPDDVREWERLQKFKVRLLTAPTAPLDNAGQSGTTAPPGDLPPSRRRNGK
jgi:predicted DNA-binding transcriptional regulator AlpA